MQVIIKHKIEGTINLYSSNVLLVTNFIAVDKKKLVIQIITKKIKNEIRNITKNII